ncbi:MAG: periplasmic heavy metal sensor [Pseudomonadota bacterium]
MSTEMNPAPPQSAGKPMRLWVRILLVMSLALNLLVIGAVAGVAIKGGPWKHGGSPPMAASGVGPFTHALSKRDRRAIGREMRQRGQESGWDRRAHRAALERMVLLLEATPFDAEAFKGEMKTAVTGLQGRMGDASEALAKRVEQMTDEERAAYVARIKEKMVRKRP